MGAANIATAWMQTILEVAGNDIANEARKRDQALQTEMLRAAEADALHRGAQEAGRTRMQGSRLAARQHVAYAASGVDPTVGTPLDVMADTRMISELDAQTQQNNAAREAWGFAMQRRRLKNQGELDDQLYGFRQAGTALGGIGKIAGAAGGAYGGS